MRYCLLAHLAECNKSVGLHHKDIIAFSLSRLCFIDSYSLLEYISYPFGAPDSILCAHSVSSRQVSDCWRWCKLYSLLSKHASQRLRNKVLSIWKYHCTQYLKHRESGVFRNLSWGERKHMSGQAVAVSVCTQHKWKKQPTQSFKYMSLVFRNTTSCFHVTRFILSKRWRVFVPLFCFVLWKIYFLKT